MRLAVWLTLLLMSCDVDRLRPAEASVRLEPEGGLTFPVTFLGSERERVVSVVNERRAPAAVTVSTSGPFELEVGPALQIAGGETREVAVRFRPTIAGSHGGTFTLGFEDRKQSIALVGGAVEPPPCPSSVCSPGRFDQELGGCVQETLPDGVSCSDACTVSGTCLNGTCEGVKVSCDDGDACTEDLCDGTTGCVHPPLECAPPENPCAASLCDPIAGCRITPVADGTSCGRKGCVVADVCIDGACVERTPPDGATCGEPSPCQPQGICRAQVCERPMALALVPEWTVPGARIELIDGNGNIFFSRDKPSVGTGSEIVSIAPDGRLRFEASIDAYFYPIYFHFERAGVVVLTHLPVNGTAYRISAVDSRSGVHLWTHEVEPLVRPYVTHLEPEPGYQISWRVVPMGDDVGLIVNVARKETNLPPSGSFLFVINRWTGAVKSQSALNDTYAQLPVVDAKGIVFLGSDRSVSALAPDGTVRWERPLADFAGPVAVSNGNLVVSVWKPNSWWHRHEIWNAATGATLSSSAGDGSWPRLVMSPTRAFFSGLPPQQPDAGVSIEAVDPVTGTSAWSTNVPEIGYDEYDSQLVPLLESKSLLAVWSRRKQPRELDREGGLRAWSLDGDLAIECRFADPYALYSPRILDGRLVGMTRTGVSSFALPGMKPAAHGWVTEDGDPRGGWAEK